MDQNHKEHSSFITYRQAILWLLLSTLMFSGTAALGLSYYRHVRGQYVHDDTYRIIAIVQSTPDKESLKIAYLSELLGLSVDRPSNLYQFNAKEARRKLLACPLIKEAQIKKIRPGMLFIDYEMRQPIAILLDYNNTAVDEDSVSFPLNPFFTPKRLPEIYLGLSGECEWGKKIDSPEMALAQTVLGHISENYYLGQTYIKRIDVSQAYDSSCGQRQIVVILEEHEIRQHNDQPVLVKTPHMVRLATHNFEQGLDNYFALAGSLAEGVELEAGLNASVVEVKPIVVDLRLEQLGFVSQAL